MRVSGDWVKTLFDKLIFMCTININTYILLYLNSKFLLVYYNVVALLVWRSKSDSECPLDLDVWFLAKQYFKRKNGKIK